MSSSSSARSLASPRGRVLRGGVVPVAAPTAPSPAALDRDLASVAEAVRAWSPEQVAAAIEAGYRDGLERGIQEGLAEGMAQGIAQAQVTEASRQAGAESALHALAVAADELHARQAAAVVAVEAELVETALALVDALLGRELADPGGATRAALQRALALAPPDTTVTAVLHPDDLAALAPHGSGARAMTWEDPVTGRCVQLAGDERVERGGCVADAGDTHIDAQLGPAIARVRSALTGGDPEEVVA
jgi:flagellar assembly protein FliH